jgi:hypothetical protein
MNTSAIMRVAKCLRDASNAASLEEAHDVCGESLELLNNAIDEDVECGHRSSTGLLERMVHAELLAALGLLLGNMSKLTKSLNITEDDDTPPVVYASAYIYIYAVSKIIQNAESVACTMTEPVLISTMFNILLDLRFLGDVRQLCAMALCVLDDKPSRP